MKCLYLKLKNYIGIYNGMGLKSIELDFSKKDFKFIIFAGENGSGKSTIQNEIQPFAKGGSSKPKFIRAGKNGYKEIHFQKSDGTIYIIKHYFDPKKEGHSTKSFIAKHVPGGVPMELNENGNVTSFNEHVFMELGINIDYLNLIQMGAEMSGIIEMSATKRKDYIGKFISEADAYLKLYKDVNGKVREYKSVIKNITDKLDKLDDPTIIKEDIDMMDRKIVKLNENRDTLIAEMNSARGAIIALDPDGKLEREYDRLMNELHQVNRSIEESERREMSSPFNFTHSKDAERERNHLSKAIALDEEKLTRLEESVTSKMNKFHVIQNKISEYESQLFSMNDYNLEETRKANALYMKKYKDIQHNIKIMVDVPKLSATEIVSIYNMVDGIQDTVDAMRQISDNIIQDIGKQSLKDLKDMYLSKSSAQERAERELKQVEQQMHENQGAVTLAKTLQLRPKECTIDDCPFIKEALASIHVIESYNKNSERAEELGKMIGNLEMELTYISQQIELARQVKHIMKQLERYSDTIKLTRTPQLLQKEYIIKCIKTGQPLYNKEHSIMEVEDAETVKELKAIEEKLPMLQNELNLLEANERMVQSIRREIETLQQEAITISGELKLLKAEITSINDRLEKSKELSSWTERSIQNLKEKEELVESQHNITTTLAKYTESINKIHKCRASIHERKGELNPIEFSLSELNNKRDKLNVKHKMAKRFTKEKDALEKNYVELELLRTALSSTKGIPIKFVDMYLRKTRLIANEFLEEAFDGKFKLGNFIINEREFRIPCVGKGDPNEDISTASSGEKAMLGLALSFALSNQSSSNYDILLLDELDGPLDKKNRRLFLKKLEGQMDDMGMEQCHIISHNDAFSTRDTGLVLLKGHKLDNYKQSNVIFEY